MPTYKVTIQGGDSAAPTTVSVEVEAANEREAKAKALLEAGFPPMDDQKITIEKVQ